MKQIVHLVLWMIISTTLLSAGNTLKSVEIKNHELQLAFASWLNTNNVRQMALIDPPRQVIDIKDTALQNGIAASSLTANGVRSFRIAQRDGNTVRIVIETESSYACKGYQSLSSRNFYRIPLPKAGRSLQQRKETANEDTPQSQPEKTKPTPVKRERRSPQTKAAPYKEVELQEVQEVEEEPQKKPSFFASLFSSSKRSTGSSKLKSTYTVVVDAGHGGHDSGAIGEKKYFEKNIVLAISKRAEKHLKKMGFRVKMTRSGDNFVELKHRTKFANRNKADIFVSVHANAIPDPRKFNNIYGVETYFLQTTRSEKAKRIAAIENSVVLDKNDFLSQNVILEAVLSGPKIELSHKLAIDIQTKILGNTRKRYRDVKDGGVKPAPFWVLVGAQMPSVLVEVGYVSNPAECRRLVSSDYQDRVAKGIAEGIYNYLLLREKAMY